jgi:hypothetical protein
MASVMSTQERRDKISSSMDWLFWIGAFMLAIFLVAAIKWSGEDTAPFALLNYEAPAFVVGQNLVVKADVRRDVSRSCSFRSTKTLYDGHGVKLVEYPELRLSASTLHSRTLMFKDKLSLSVPTPEGMSPGPVVLKVLLEYECNPLHRVWPIQVRLEIVSTALAAERLK